MEIENKEFLRMPEKRIVEKNKKSVIYEPLSLRMKKNEMFTHKKTKSSFKLPAFRSKTELN